jgi:hypothetical protein
MFNLSFFLFDDNESLSLLRKKKIELLLFQ